MTGAFLDARRLGMMSTLGGSSPSFTRCCVESELGSVVDPTPTTPLSGHLDVDRRGLPDKKKTRATQAFLHGCASKVGGVRTGALHTT